MKSDNLNSVIRARNDLARIVKLRETELSLRDQEIARIKNSQRYIVLGGGSIQESKNGEYMLALDVLNA